VSTCALERVKWLVTLPFIHHDKKEGGTFAWTISWASAPQEINTTHTNKPQQRKEEKQTHLGVASHAQCNRAIQCIKITLGVLPHDLQEAIEACTRLHRLINTIGCTEGNIYVKIDDENIVALCFFPLSSSPSRLTRVLPSYPSYPSPALFPLDPGQAWSHTFSSLP